MHAGTRVSESSRGVTASIHRVYARSTVHVASSRQGSMTPDFRAVCLASLSQEREYSSRATEIRIIYGTHYSNDDIPR